MKFLASAALAVLLACPAYADWRKQYVTVACTYDYNNLTEAHGELEIVFGPVKNGKGVAISVMEGQDAQIMVVTEPSGKFCVVWGAQKDGDPA